jgi:carboxypeptidase T
MKKNMLLVFFGILVIFNLLCSAIPAIILHKNNILEEEYDYYSYQKMTELLENLSADYSRILNLSSIGKTYQQRDIWMVKISDNVSIEEEEPGVLLMGAHHGNEKPSFEVMIFYIKYLLERYSMNNTDDDNDGKTNEDIIDGIDNDSDGLIDEDPSEDRVRDIINNTQIYIIPMVSPDGVEANSRKNCVPNHGWFGKRKTVTSYGVNLNRNYGYDWYLYKTRPLRFHLFSNMRDYYPNYRGPYPFSENETTAVKEFVENTSLSISLSYHCFGSIIFYPWFHTGQPTPDHETFMSVGENISKINKYELFIHPKIPFIKYYGNLGISENWLYGKHKIIAFLIEIEGTSFEPKDPELVFNICWKHVGVNHYICEASNII